MKTGKLGLSPRGERATELDTLEKAIMSYLEGNDGFMRFNDKSSPEEIKTVFNSSKKNFKRALGCFNEEKPYNSRRRRMS